jgi:hypothetical protein
MLHRSSSPAAVRARWRDDEIIALKFEVNVVS